MNLRRDPQITAMHLLRARSVILQMGLALAATSAAGAHETQHYHDQNLNTSLMNPSRVTTAAPIPGLQKKQAGTHVPPDARDIASAACAQYLRSYTEAYNDYVDSWERGNMLSTMANARAYDTYLERAREAWEVYQQACLSSYNTAPSPEPAHYPNTRHLIDVALRSSSSSSSSPKPPPPRVTNAAAAFTPSSHLGTHGDLRRRQADDVSEARPPSGSKAAPTHPPPPAYTPAAATATTTTAIDTHDEKDEASDMWTVQSHNTDPDPPGYGLPATDAKTFASYRVMTTTTSSEVIPSYGVSAAAASSEDDHEPPETGTETEATGSSSKSGTRTLPVFTRTTQPTTDPDYGVPTATTGSGDGLSEAAATATESLVLINAAPGGGGGGRVMKEVVMLLVIGMGLYAGGILFGC